LRAAVLTRPSAISARPLRVEDVPRPQPGPGDVLVQVEAVSIEGGDTLNRLQGGLATTPHVVGYQCAGTITSVGDQVREFRSGDRVVTLGLFGSHAELPKAITDLSDEIVDWDERALVDAIRRQARHEDTTRWDTIEFKLD